MKNKKKASLQDKARAQKERCPTTAAHHALTRISQIVRCVYFRDATMHYAKPAGQVYSAQHWPTETSSNPLTIQLLA